MQNTTNLNLKKPDYTDFADIQDINDNMDTIDAELAAPTGDSANSTTTFTCSDVADGSASSWTTVPALTSGETHKSLFAKMSQMFKNIRYLYKMLGTTDISSIGNGTVTGGLSSLNDSFTNMHTPVYEHDLQRSYNISAETGWKMMYICAIDGVNNLRCEAFIPSTDIDTTSRFHYLGGYLGAGNFLSASVAVSRSSVNLASLIRNGSEVNNGYIAVRMFK